MIKFIRSLNRNLATVKFRVPLFVLSLFVGYDWGTARETAAPGPLKVFILAGDESILENGIVQGLTEDVNFDFYTHPEPVEGEPEKHVNAAVYKGNYKTGIEYDKLEPQETAVVEIGEQRTRQANPNQRGRVPVPMTPFPDLAYMDGYTTVLRGFVSVSLRGKYEFHPGSGESAFNLTTVDGREAYRREPGQAEPRTTPVALEPGRRYAFKTVFFKEPGHAFSLSLNNKPGVLTTVVEENEKYAFLKDPDGNWVTRDDVVLYDAHPIHNNTEAPAKPLSVGVMGLGGPERTAVMGVDLMLGHVLGDAFDEQVMLIRFGTRHPIWFMRGSRDLAHDYLPPSSGGGSDLDGSWDVIHFNFGVWDALYREETFKFFSGHNITSVEDFENNLRTMVAKMKETGATLVWGTVTPVWEGEPGKRNADVDAFNEAAARVMEENGVIINDLNAEVRRQGYPKSNDVHSVGNLAPKVTETILDVLAKREENTRPLPRVLFIGDSITGSYIRQVSENLDGKAFVCKNPGNAQGTWNGLKRIDEWLDLNQYLLNGQEYLELLEGIKKVTENEPVRAYPEYAGQELELGGLVWMHGIADSMSESKAASYETNLANLIRDLRRDLDAPKLPVVVVAMAKSGGAMNAKEKMVFDAQMAVGNTEKYPEFNGNVISIDTRPFCRPREMSPGGRDRFIGNAESYLEIGEAIARALFEQADNPKAE